MNIEINGIGYEIKRNKHEIDENYQMRLLFVSLLKPNTLKKFNEAVMYSNIWINIEFLKCKYSSIIENKITKIIESSGTNLKNKIKNLKT